MNIHHTSHPHFVAVELSIVIPALGADEQPFPNKCRTFIPSTMSQEEARTHLVNTIYNGAMAHIMEALAVEASVAQQLLTREMIIIEFLPTSTIKKDLR